MNQNKRRSVVLVSGARRYYNSNLYEADSYLVIIIWFIKFDLWIAWSWMNGIRRKTKTKIIISLDQTMGIYQKNLILINSDYVLWFKITNDQNSQLSWTV